jgi:16S rRNA (uracil1498-N3)-methyltransferase
MHLFYTPDIVPGQQHYTLTEEESRHCTRVLRLHEGAELKLVDGQGTMFSGRISEVHPKQTRVSLVSHTEAYGKRNYYLHLAIAPTKNTDRLEWFVEKATEAGIDEITPLICVRSERKAIKTERLVKVAVAAMKQSLKAYLPRINPAVTFNSFVAEHQHRKPLIAHCMKGEKGYLTDLLRPGEPVVALIGPEGDFHADEVAKAREMGCRPISLGAARLRTETAALAVCFEVNFLNR